MHVLSALLALTSGAIAATSTGLPSPQLAAVEAGIRTVLAGGHVVQAMAAPAPAIGAGAMTVCGLAGVGKASRTDALPFIGILEAAKFRVTLLGRTGRDDFTVRNMCSAEGLDL